MPPMHDLVLSGTIEADLLRYGADIVGFGNLSELPEDVRDGLPIGISIAVAYPGAVIDGITELPTQEYLAWYDTLNDQLDEIVIHGADTLCSMGYKAVAQSRKNVRKGDAKFSTILPHKRQSRHAPAWAGSANAHCLSRNVMAPQSGCHLS